MLTNLDKSQFSLKGERGLPEHYPVPDQIDNLLFYIQRNLNKNTIVYALNINTKGSINEIYPMKVFWIKYTDGGVKAELNFIQNKAFGYTSEKINDDAFNFHMDSYPALKFYIARKEGGNFQIVSNIQGKKAILSNIYVFANELGLFPKVEYIELYGTYIENDFPCYEKILI